MAISTETETTAQRSSLWTGAAVGAMRAAFGLIWAINAFLTWRPEFAAHYVGYLKNAALNQPEWLAPWFNAWISVVTPGQTVFIWLTRIIETLLALGLLFGLARKWIYILGGIFSLLIWSTAEGFGGPYITGVSNIGSALIYVLLFAALLVFERILGCSPYSMDYYLEERYPGWRRVAEIAPEGVLEQRPVRLSWAVQGIAIVGMLVAAVFFFGTLQSALAASPATPANASAAVTPLQLMSSDPVVHPFDATLPPLLGEGSDVSITMTSTDRTVEIASGVQYQAWTFGDTVPAPIIHVRQGQTVHVTYVNNGIMDHSIDFHAAMIDPHVAFANVKPGQSHEFSFTANVPGVYVYHCGTPPVLMHMGMGMYGAIVVDPIDNSLPPADANYVIVQSEWYTKQVKGNLVTGDFNKMLAVQPDLVVFNGIAFQYRDHPLQAKVGQRVRLYFVDAGPNLMSSFHVIGWIFDKVYPGGDGSQAISGVSTYPVAAGQGVIFDLVFDKPGNYVMVDHSMRSVFMGSVGVIEVTE